jgi:hypothetical protein
VFFRIWEREVHDARSLIQRERERERERDVFYLMKLWKATFIQHDGRRVYVWAWSFKRMTLTGVQGSTRRRKNNPRHTLLPLSPRWMGGHLSSDSKVTGRWLTPWGLTVLMIKIPAFCAETPSTLVWRYQLFGEFYCLYLHTTWRRRQQISPKRFYLYTNIQCIIFCRTGNLEPNHVADWLYKFKILIK